VRLGREPGAVVVVAPTRAPLDEVWRALTEPARVGQWLGTLTAELVPGGRARLDFGDGDFFDLDVEEVAKPVLRWDWRFMGCGPRDSVEVRVEARHDGSVVTVSDREPHRSREDSLGLGEGWRDFTSRLQRHVATGAHSRYDWRSDVDVSIELPLEADAARRLVIGSAAEWLPLEDGAPNLIAADALVLDDGREPASFAIAGIESAGRASVRFALRPDGIDGSLTTGISVVARDGGVTLAISQTGFRDLPADDVTQRLLRERFAAAWLAAARRAGELAERTDHPGPRRGNAVTLRGLKRRSLLGLRRLGEYFVESMERPYGPIVFFVPWPYLRVMRSSRQSMRRLR
jgi:uncharacterized protein YndB with AHSA1/START domain